MGGKECRKYEAAGESQLPCVMSLSDNEAE
jgi:hypothetical protein